MWCLRVAEKKLTKVIKQYSKGGLEEDAINKLLVVAKAYGRTKAYVHNRYSGIGALPKLNPGFAIISEVKEAAKKGEIKLPPSYIEIAVFDALADIKSQWALIKNEIKGAAERNDNFLEEDKHYIRFVLKVDGLFGAALSHKEMEIPEKLRDAYIEASRDVDTHRLNNYIHRQARKFRHKIIADAGNSFSINKNVCRYADHGIYISTLESGKRVFIPLTDNHSYKRQSVVLLKPEEKRLELHVPVEGKVKSHEDYVNEVSVTFGMTVLMTTDTGHEYGNEFGRLQKEYADWSREETRRHNKERDKGNGASIYGKKYHAKKRRMEERLHSYINQEIARFIREEKPKTVYIIKSFAHHERTKDADVNYMLSTWQRGYIKERLTFKCAEQAVLVKEIYRSQT